MSDYNNPRPLPTASASDPCTIVDNAISFDKVVNGDSTVTTYQGKELLSLSQAIDKFGFGVAPFTFTTGGTLESKNLLVSNDPVDGFLYKYVGSHDFSTPLTIAAGTNPTVGGDWQPFAATDHNFLSNRNAAGAHDEIYRRSATVAQVQNGDFEIGARLSLTDRAEAPFNIEPIGTYVVNGTDILNAGDATVAVYSMAERQIHVEHLGADGSGANLSTSAIKRAVALLSIGGIGGEVIADRTYLIDEEIFTGSRIVVNGRKSGVIRQESNDIGILSPIAENLNRDWAYRDIQLEYVNQQVTSGFSSIRLSDVNKLTYMYEISGVRIRKGFHGIYSPEGNQSLTFLGKIFNTIIEDCSDYGVKILGDVSGAHTNLSLDQVWVVQSTGEEKPASKGYDIRRVQDLIIGRIATDHTQGQSVFLESCTGKIDSISIESCDFTYLANINSAITLSSCNITIDNTMFVGNTVTLTGNADFNIILLNNGTNFESGVITDLLNTVNDTSSGSFSTVYAFDAASKMNNAIYSGPTPVLRDANSPRVVRSFGGLSRTEYYGKKAGHAAGDFIDTGAGTSLLSATVNLGLTVSDTTPAVYPLITEATTSGLIKVRFFNRITGDQDFGTYAVTWDAKVL